MHPILLLVEPTENHLEMTILFAFERYTFNVSNTSVKILGTADVDPSAQIGTGSCIWHLAQVRNAAIIGSNCVIGRGAYIGSGVKIGNNCKIQNYALVYEPAVLGNGVFIGPAAILTNDQYPRAVNFDGTIKLNSDWDSVGVEVCEGASIGAGAICIAPVKVGAWALVAAGAVVKDDVPNFALVAGVPARRIRWVGRAGKPLNKISDTSYKCPTTGALYKQVGPNELVEEGV
jgi:UDP-2-acetamido-3-amino-2,3-dideoxy-glucuronate N-acetyltransferase